MPPIVAGQRVSVLDPACGDGRFLAAAADHVAAAGGIAVLHGVDVDAGAVDAARGSLAGRGDVRVEVGDALARDWGDATYDVVLGNPPYLSQLAAATSRGGASARGGGPYADAAAEFLVLAVGLARPGGGRVGLRAPAVDPRIPRRRTGPGRRSSSWPSRSGRGGRRGCTSTPRCSSARSASSAALAGNRATTRAATANPCGPESSPGRWASLTAAALPPPGASAITPR